MSDFTLELPDGSKHEFPALTVKEYEALQGRVAEQFRKENRRLADEIGLLGLERGRFLKEHDPRSISINEVEVFISDDRRARSILAQSLAKKGKTGEDAEKLIASLTIVDRAVIAKHVAGLIDLNPLPEEDRKASDLMKGLVLKHFPGLDVASMSVGDFYRLVAELVPPEPVDPQSWFTQNTVAGSIKKIA